MRFIGIDPGSKTGVVVVDAVPVAGVGLGPEACQLLEASTITASTSKYLTDAEQDGTIYNKLVETLRVWQPTVAVVEEAADIGTSWRGGKARQGRTTAFAVGKSYGLILGALHDDTARVERIYSYLCKGVTDKIVTVKGVLRRSRKAREGWMPRQAPTGFKGNAVMAHDDQLRFHRLRVAQMRGMESDMTERLSEHEVFAAGVLLYHLSKPFTGLTYK